MFPTTPLIDLCDSSRGITYGIVKVGDFVPGGVRVVRGGEIRNNAITSSFGLSGVEGAVVRLGADRAGGGGLRV